MPRLRPPLFPFESQAVLGLVCVLCKCRVGGERLISGIAGCVGGGCQGGAVLWIGWLGGGRCERPLSARGGRCRSQVKVRRPRLPARPCSPSGTLLLCSPLLRAVSAPSEFQGVGIMVSCSSWGNDQQTDTLPCPAEGKAGRILQQENSHTVADCGFLLGNAQQVNFSFWTTACAGSAHMGTRSGSGHPSPLTLKAFVWVVLQCTVCSLCFCLCCGYS